jgi:hypothetical protein
LKTIFSHLQKKATFWKLSNLLLGEFETREGNVKIPAKQQLFAALSKLSTAVTDATLPFLQLLAA